MKLINKHRGGFSLVEMLVVIAVIGIIAAIAVPNIGRINEAAEQSKDMRNAQNIASVCASAQSAGHDFVAAAVDPTSQHWVTHEIMEGATISEAGNPFNGTFFGVPNLSEDEMYGAQPYLEVVNGMLTYNQAGDSVDPVISIP